MKHASVAHEQTLGTPAVAGVRGAGDASASRVPGRDIEDLVVAARQAMRLEVLMDLLMLTDAGIVLNSAALRDLIGKVQAAANEDSPDA